MALEKEYGYFLKNKDTLLKKYEGRFIVVVGEEIIGDFKSQDEALKEAVKTHTAGTFLIQKVSKDENDTMQRFFSMVYF